MFPVSNSCFETDCSCISERIHLPVANQCRANCFYCQFRFNGNISAEHMPGHSLYVPEGKESIKTYLNNRLKLMPGCRLIGISGPGDILTSQTQLEKLIELLSEKQYKNLISCICTNGWDFPITRHLLEKWSSLKFATLTINSLDAAVCDRIYIHKDKTHAAINEEIENQLSMLSWLESRKVMIKINTVLCEQNSDDILDMWRFLRSQYNVHIFNLIQIQGSSLSSDSKFALSKKYFEIMNAAQIAGFPLKVNCHHCRSDSYGRW